jgi:WD40 repeat protein
MGLKTSEIYQPSTGVFTPSSTMNEARYGHTGTLLPTGDVLIVGGHGANYQYLGSAELYSENLGCSSVGDAGGEYDPPVNQPGTFTSTGDMLSPRALHTSTPLRDGTVLVAGGNNQGQLLSSAEIYDQTMMSFTSTGDMTAARSSHSATLLSDGTVLVAGGTNLASAELYNPASANFTPTGTMTTERAGHSSTLLADGRVLIAGGTDLGNNSLSSAEIYDQASELFTATGAMNAARSGHSAILLVDGTVLITGGSALPTAELYDPATGTFSLLASSTSASTGSVSTLLQDGSVMVSTGMGTEIYDPSTHAFSYIATWTTSLGSWNSTPGFTATLLQNGTVLIAGTNQANIEGNLEGHSYKTPKAMLYRPRSKTFVDTGSPLPRYERRATLLPNGKVLVTGGTAVDSSNFVTTSSSAELYY